MKKQSGTAGRFAIAAVAALVINGPAQSVDALLDKLVDKGVLSVTEAKELRAETDKNFTKAYSAKSGMPEWVTSLKFNAFVHELVQQGVHGLPAGRRCQG